MSRRRKYTTEFKLNVVREYLSGQNGGYRMLAQKYGIPPSVLKRWVGLFKTHGEKIIEEINKQ